MTLDDSIAKRDAMARGTDAELAHGEADDVLCGFLRQLGYTDLVDAYENARDRVGFWYAQP